MKRCKEIWKDIKDYEGIYQISSLGKVKSLKRKVKNGNGYRRVEEKIIKPAKDKNGYLFVQLHKNNITKMKKIYRLVAEAFIPNPNNLPQVNYKDENKLNNRADNLRWASYIVQANNKDKTNIIKNMKILGKKSYKNRAEKVKQYDLNNNFIKEFISSREASKLLNISETSISNCINGYSKSAGGYIWTH